MMAACIDKLDIADPLDPHPGESALARITQGLLLFNIV
jgi:hypothetical protein